MSNTTAKPDTTAPQDFPTPEAKAIFEMTDWMTCRLVSLYEGVTGYKLVSLLAEVMVRLNRLEGKSLTATPESLRDSK